MLFCIAVSEYPATLLLLVVAICTTTIPCEFLCQVLVRIAG